MNLEELRTTAAQSAQQLRDQGASLTSASQGIGDQGRVVLGVLGSHRSANPTGAAISGSVTALSEAASHCEQAASAIDAWVGSNF